MSQSLKRKTKLFLLLQAPVLHSYFNKAVFPGRCRKESSPGYKEYISQTKNIPEEFTALNSSVILRIVHFSILNTSHHLKTILVSAIKNINSFFTQYPILKAIIYTDV